MWFLLIVIHGDQEGQARHVVKVCSRGRTIVDTCVDIDIKFWMSKGSGNWELSCEVAKGINRV